MVGDGLKAWLDGLKAVVTQITIWHFVIKNMFAAYFGTSMIILKHGIFL